MAKDEFYVGYLNDAPAHTAHTMKKVIIAFGIFSCGASLLLAVFQKQFASTRFDFGVKTTVEGFLYTTPLPHLEVDLGETNGHKLVQNIMLVGSGKSSAKSVIETIERKRNKRLVGFNVQLTGELIYGDGKTLMQITAEDNTMIHIETAIPKQPTKWNSTGVKKMSGEIVDPKCFFGVMKPGEGKTHRACAIRCISGGIPPVFHSQSGEYFVLLDENSEPPNLEILSFVGDQITLEGESFAWNNWNILTVSTEDLRMMSARKSREQTLFSFQEGITMCKMN